MLKFLLVEPVENGFKAIPDKIFKAKTPLKAAKKAYRDDKSLEKIYLYQEREKKVYVFDTSSFFTVKKPHLLTRD